MDITVIIPTYNRSELLGKTLEGFCEQTVSPLLYELIVVSDASTDSTHETVRRFKDRLPLRYLSQPKRGVSSARNLGLREAHSSIVLFVDDDVIPSAHLIEEHIRFHRERSELESVLLGYVTWYPEVVITPFMQWYGEFGGLFGYSRLTDNAVGNPRYLYTCNISFKSEFLRLYGGFDESLSVLEDHELGHRLSKGGMKMYFRRAALGYHNQSFTFDQACRRLERYSHGLPAFFATEAGQAMITRRERLSFRVANSAVRIIGPTLRPFRRILDSRIKLPNMIYRLYYWYFADQYFWSRPTQLIGAAKESIN